MGDWLINYQGGFIRRGLFGEIALILSSYADINTGLIVFLVQIVLYLVFFIFSYFLLKEQKLLTPYILLIFSPFIFAFQIHNVDGGFRKEIIYFALLSFVAWSSTRYQEKIFEKIVYGILLIYPLVILTHEMLAVFLPYIVAIYIVKLDLNVKRLVTLAVFISLSVVSFILALLYPGTHEQVTLIFDSLVDYSVEGGAISWLDKSASFGYNHLRAEFLSWGSIAGFSFTLVLSSLAYIPITKKIHLLFHNQEARYLILFSLIGTLPLFIVAVDWGRFVYIHLVSIFILSMLMPSNTLNMNLKFNGMLEAISNKRLLLVPASVFFIAYSTSWYIRHTL
ncbi:MAG: hypothetical protein JKY98_00855 [Gammaproteobacteria bacterium]|nr:hypothetical protein [Gammaproteobacteria bacterium]